MKLKISFILSLCLIACTSFAKPFTPIISVTSNSTCGAPPAAIKDPTWCNCFSNYLIETCKQYGGGEICVDKKLRDIIAQYGVSTVCMLNSDSSMDQEACESSLNYYLDQCPIRN